MSGYKAFAIAGAGNIGKPIIEELAKLKKEGVISSIVILTRSPKGYEKFVELGATIATVSYDDPASLASALKGVDVVISTLGGGALRDGQEALAVAAKQNGVKLFLPSEFGFPTKGHTEGVFGIKNDFREKLVELGVPFSCWYVGMFSDTTFIPMLGFDLKNGTATFGGTGDEELSFTSSVDIARFVAHALTSLPKSKLENSFFSIEAERTTLNKVLAEYEAHTGKAVQIHRLSVEEVKEAAKTNPADIVNRLRIRWITDGTIGEDLSNNEWPEWNPRKVMDIILEQAAAL